MTIWLFPTNKNENLNQDTSSSFTQYVICHPDRVVTDFNFSPTKGHIYTYIYVCMYVSIYMYICITRIGDGKFWNLIYFVTPTKLNR